MAQFFYEDSKEPSKENNSTQNLNGEQFGVENYTVKIEWSFSARRPEAESGLWQSNPLFSRPIEDRGGVLASPSAPCRDGLLNCGRD
jgi:hypothetical protein